MNENCHTMTPAEIAAIAKERGMSIAKLCQEAGLGPATWYRWQAGLGDITLGTYQKLVAAVARDGD